MTLLDTPQRYGLISRLLHWLMAIGILWQFFGALCHFFLSQENALRAFFWPSHFTLGFVLFIAVLLRGLWGAINLHRRPPQPKNMLGLVAHIGHGLLYLLMIVVPLLALIRAYGYGRGFSVFGFEILPATGVQEQGLMALGNQFHGQLGWILLILIIGHMAMACFHQFIIKDDVARRMI